MKKFFYALMTMAVVAALVGLGVHFIRTQPMPVKARTTVTVKLPLPTTEQWNLSMSLQQKHQALINPDRKQILVDRAYWESLGDGTKRDVALDLLHVAHSMDASHECYDVADLKTGQILATWQHTGRAPKLVFK